MFETTVVESRVAHGSRTRAMSLPVSVGLHAAIIGTAILASAWSVAMPNASPPQIKPFIMRVLPTIPAPVRPAPPRQPEPQPPAGPSPSAAGPVVDAPPAQIPSDIPNLTPGDATGPIEGPVQWDWIGTGDTGGGGGVGIVTEPTGPYPVVAGGATKPITIRRVEPVYPPLLVRAKMSGYAIVECIVEKDGRITSAEVVETNHVLFGDAARAAVLQWTFLPGRLNGDPVPTIFSLTVNFQVRR
jgi:protein TonB